MDDNEYETYDADEHIDAEFEEELKKHVAEDEAAIYGDEEEEDLEEEVENNATTFAQLTSVQVKDDSSQPSFSSEPKLQAKKEPEVELEHDEGQEAGPSTSSSFYHQQNNNNLPQITSTQLLPQKASTQSFPYDDPVVHNIVATANFSVPLDLNQIVVKIRNSEYNPKRFRAVIMRIYEPRTTMMLFSSGKVVITGAKSDRDACTAARKCCRILQLIGYEVRRWSF